MELTEDSFRALARSSPWRWTTLHFTHVDGSGQVEAWVRRPGRLLVREGGRRDAYYSGVPYSSTTLWASDDPDFVAPPEVHRVPQDVRPELRPDGLVAERPSDWDIDYDDPMHVNFTWVAMLDPVELSHHVRVENPREVELAGRRTWAAYLVPELGYEPRCGGNCCELLYSEAGLRADFPEADDVPADWRGREYPDGFEVALDVQTGVVAQLTPVGGAPRDDLAFSNTILEVDVQVDDIFAPYD